MVDSTALCEVRVGCPDAPENGEPTLFVRPSVRSASVRPTLQSPADLDGRNKKGRSHASSHG